MKLDLDIIASTLEGLEETIIHKLIDRAQFRINEIIYVAGRSGFGDEHARSLFDLRLFHQESMDALFGRYCVPEERPFSANLPAPRRSAVLPETGLVLKNYNIVNLGPEIRLSFMALLRNICTEGDDGHYGSSTEHDVYALQALARRIHYGSFYVAESKWQQDPAGYDALIAAHDVAGLLARLTRQSVEDAIVERVREKTAYIQARVNRNVRCYVDPDVIVQFYREHIIPLTKKGEIAYLMNRGRG